MSKFHAVYYPFFDPPPHWLRAMLLFYDKIAYIIPSSVKKRGVQHVPANKMIFDRLPDAYDTITEEQYDLEVVEDGAGRLKRALDLVAEDRKSNGKNASFPARDSRGELNVGGMSWLHHSKASRNVIEMLRRRGLIYQDFPDDAAEDGEYYQVDRAAATLIVSSLADYCASQKGLRCLTSETLPFCLTGLGRFLADSSRAHEARLATGIIQMEIPRRILEFSPDEFVELRKRHEDLKPLFHSAIRMILDQEMLGDIKAPEEYQQRLTAAMTSFSTKVSDFRMSKYATKIQDWAPIATTAFGGLLSLTGSVPLTLLGTGLAVSVQVYEKHKRVPPTMPTEQSQRLLAELQGEILDPTRLDRILRKLHGDVSCD